MQRTDSFETPKVIFGGVPKPTLAKTRHALQRQYERHISDEAIVATLRWGKVRVQRLGQQEYRLDQDNIAIADACGAKIAQHLGTVVILSRHGYVITVFHRR